MAEVSNTPSGWLRNRGVKPLHARRYLLIQIRFLNRWGLRLDRWSRTLRGRAARITDQAAEDYRRD